MALGRRSILNIKITRDESTALESYTCDWEEAIRLSYQFVGGYLSVDGIPKWQPPTAFTELPELRCIDCEITPLGDQISNGGIGDDPEQDAEDISDEEEEADDADTQPGEEDPAADVGTYKTALLTVSYGLLKPSEENSDPNQVYEIEISFNGEGLQIPGNANYKWASGPDDGKPLPPEVYATKIIPAMEITCRYRYRPTLPVAVINSCQGMLNETDVTIANQSFEADTVLFAGCGSHPTQSTDGVNGWSRELKVLIKPSGWNYLWHPASHAYHSIEPPLYDDTDLSQLFEQ